MSSTLKRTAPRHWAIVQPAPAEEKKPAVLSSPIQLRKISTDTAKEKLQPDTDVDAGPFKKRESMTVVDH